MKPLQRYGLLLAIVWLIAITLGYLISQPPVDFRSAATLVHLMQLVVGPIVSMMFAGALGTIVLGDSLRGLDAAGRVAIAALVGVAGLAVVVLTLGLIRYYPPTWLAWLLTIASLIPLREGLVRWISDGRSLLKLVFAPTDDLIIRWLRRGAVFLVLLALPLTLLPPTSWDALVYHLEAPRFYLEAGGIVGFAENHHFGFPQLMESLYLWIMILSGPNAATMLHWCMGAIALLLVMSFATQLENQTVGWLAVVVLLASPSVWKELWIAYNDLTLMAYTLGTVLVIWHWRDKHDHRLLVLAGALIGCMMATKYSAASYTIGIGLLIVWLSRKERPANIIRNLGIVVGTALVALSPWLLKNLLIDQNPVSPFIWGTSAFDHLDAAHYLRSGTGIDILSLLVFPVEASIFGNESNFYGAVSGPLVFGLVPLTLVYWKHLDDREQGLATALLVFLLPGYVGFLIGTSISFFLAQTRLLFPLFPALAIIGALGVNRLIHADTMRGYAILTRGIIGLTFVFMLLGSSLDAISQAPTSAAAGEDGEEAYLIHQLQSHYIAMDVVNQLPDDSRVLFLWEPRAFYCNAECIPDTLIYRWWHDQQLYGSPDAVARQWEGDGVTHVLVFESGGRFLLENEPYDPMTDADWQALDTLRGQHLISVWDDLPSYTLYRLEVSP